MRAKGRIVLGVAALAALACVLAAAAWAGSKPSVQEEPAFSGERDIVYAWLDYDAGLRTLRGRQEMELTNRTDSDMEDIVLRLAMNAQDERAVAVSHVLVNGQETPYAQDGDDPTVLVIEHGFAAGETLELSFTLMVRHAKAEGGAVITLPQPAMPEGGIWRTDAYDDLADVSYAEPFDCAVWVDDALCMRRTAVRDATFALTADAKARTKTLSGVQVNMLAGPGTNSAQVMACVKEAMQSLEGIGLAYPYDRLDVIDAQTARAEGMVYSGLIALNTDADRETLRRRIIRLLARQTFGILVENDPWNAPWLSETLASCAELLAYRRLKGTAAYEERLYGEIELSTRVTRPHGVTVGAGTASFGGDAEMTQVLHDEGAFMLLGIEQAIGEEAFLRALKLYIAQNAGGVATQEAFAEALRQASGSSWDGYLADGLSF